MERFTQLFTDLDATTRTNEKVRVLREYFASVPSADAAWALALLTGVKKTRAISSRLLREWVSQQTGYPDWLVGVSHEAVGDLSETLALLLPENPNGTPKSLQEVVETYLLPLGGLTDRERHELVVAAWHELSTQQRFLFHKFISGSFRVGVSKKLIIRSLAELAELPPAIMADRLTGPFEPTPEAFEQLLAADRIEREAGRPYPFYLASPLEVDPTTLGPVDEWQVEWKWDGIRAQLIHRGELTLLWTRGEELVTDRYAEIRQVGEALPDGTVLDGEILAWENESPLPFGLLQRRIGRKQEGPRLFEEVPVVFMVYDLLERDGVDIRAKALIERRDALEQVVASLPDQHAIRLSPLVERTSWQELEELRGRTDAVGIEGLMLKRRSSPYGVGRTRGDWSKWKVDPLQADLVLVAAEQGHGKRAGLYTDYTFAAWDNGELVNVAKAYSGLTDDEIKQVDRFVRKHTTARRGPVRLVEPQLVFELAFERVQRSTRHKAGLALRFPRMARWRHDKKPDEADRVDSLRSLLQREEGL
jgi:DNA ligase-1